MRVVSTAARLARLPVHAGPNPGGIAKDAFLDTVRRADGSPLDPRITAAFDCLKETGQFCHKQ
jgi:hypothetical protein